MEDLSFDDLVPTASKSSGADISFDDLVSAQPSRVLPTPKPTLDAVWSDGMPKRKPTGLLASQAVAASETKADAPVMSGAQQPATEDDWLTVISKNLRNVPRMMEQSAYGSVLGALENPPIPMGFTGYEAEQYQADRRAMAAPASSALIGASKDVEQRIKAGAPNVEPMSVKGIVGEVPAAIANLVPAFGAGLLAGPAAGLSVLGGQVVGQQYSESRSSGRTPEQASMDAWFYAAAEAIPEAMPMGVILKGGRALLPRIGFGALAEGVQESFTETLESAYDAGVIGENMTWGEALQRILRAGLVGTATGGALGAAVHPISDAQQRAAENARFNAASSAIARQRAIDAFDPSRAQYGLVTPEDVASPIPTGLIAAGRQIMGNSTEPDIPKGAVSADVLFGRDPGSVAGAVGGGLLSRQPAASAAASPEPPRQNDLSGRPHAVEIAAAAQRFGVDPGLALVVAQIESGFNPGAANGQHQGIFQLGPREWEAMGGGDRNDVATQIDHGVRFLAQTRDNLSRFLGRDPAPWEIYLAHQQGVGGAEALLHADPGEQAVVTLSKFHGADGAARVLTANGGRADMTVGEFVGMWRDRFNNAGDGSWTSTTTPTTSQASAATTTSTTETISPPASSGLIPAPDGQPITEPAAVPDVPEPAPTAPAESAPEQPEVTPEPAVAQPAAYGPSEPVVQPASTGTPLRTWPGPDGRTWGTFETEAGTTVVRPVDGRPEPTAPAPAAQASPEVKPVAPAPVVQDAPTDLVMRANGKPFSTQKGAALAAKQKGGGFEPVEVKGGWALRKTVAPAPEPVQEPPVAPTPPSAPVAPSPSPEPAPNEANGGVAAPDVSPSEPTDTSSDDRLANLGKAVQSAYLKVANSGFNSRARLADIRPFLPPHTDEDIINLQRRYLEQGFVLIEIDDRKDIKPGDRMWAVQLGGEPRHLLWIVRPIDFDARKEPTEPTPTPEPEPEQGASQAPSAEATETADDLAKDIGGEVLFNDGDVAMARGYSAISGQPVYVGIHIGHKSRTRVDIDSYTGSMFSPEQLKKLKDAKREAVAVDEAAHAKNPDGPFKNGERFAASPGVPENLANVVRGFYSLLGLKGRLYLTTASDAASIKMNGTFAAINSATTLDNSTSGLQRKLSNGDTVIIFRPKPRLSHSVEVLAHELGHMLEKEAWSSADKGTKDAIRGEFNAWLETAKAGSARDLVSSLRAHTAGKLTSVKDGLSANSLTPYWRSFGEWFADQVSRWAVTSDKPLTVVERFFAKLGAAMRRFYEGISGKGYLPAKSVKDWLDSRGPTAVDPEVEPEPKQPEPPVEIKPKRKPRGKADGPTVPLFRFLASRGGLRDEGGELRSMGLTSRTLIGGYGPLVRKSGMPLDRARELAEEAGYFGIRTDETGWTTIDDLLTLIDGEARGNPAFPQTRDGTNAAVDRYEQKRANSNPSEREYLEAQADRYGIDSTGISDSDLAERIAQADAVESKMREVQEEDARVEAEERAALQGYLDLPHMQTMEDDGGEWVQSTPPEGWEDEADSGSNGNVQGNASRPTAVGDNQGQGAGGAGSGSRGTEGASSRPAPEVERTDQGDQEVLPGFGKMTAEERRIAEHKRTKDEAAVRAKQSAMRPTAPQESLADQEDGLFGRPAPKLFQRNASNTADQAPAPIQFKDAPDLAAKRRETAAKIEALLVRLTGKKSEVRVHDALFDGAGEPVTGGFVDGVIYVSLQDQFGGARGQDTIAATARHEVIHALRRMGAIDNTTWAILTKNAKDRWVWQFDIKRRYAGENLDTMIEEAIAEAYADWAGGRTKAHGAVERFFQWLNRMFDQVREVVRRTLGVDADARDIFARIERGLMAQVGPAAKAMPEGARQQRAYHGTPRTEPFDQFDTAHIGSGEGNAAFGWGLYFTNKKEIAAHYKAMRGTDEGRLYETDIPEDDRLLAWDKPLAEQPERVLQALGLDRAARDQATVDELHAEWESATPERRQAISRLIGILEGRIDEDTAGKGGQMTGEDVYKMWADQEGDPRAASLAMRDAGVRGIKVPAGLIASTAKPDEFNYVIFDGADVAIEASYQRPDITVNANGRPSFQSAQNAVLKALGKTRDPLEILRIPLDIFGGTDAYGQWNPGKFLDKKAVDFIENAKPAENGLFGWMNPLLEATRRGLIHRYGLDPEYIGRDYRRKSDKRRIERQAADFLDAIAKKTSDPAEMRVLQAIMEGEELNPGDWADISEPIRQAIIQFGQEQVALGQIPQESFDRNFGKYLHRAYAKYETERMQGFASRWIQTRRQKLMGDETKGRGIFMAVSPTALIRLTPEAQDARKRNALLRLLDKRRADLEDRLEIVSARRDEIQKEMIATFDRRLDTKEGARSKKGKLKPTSYKKGQAREQGVDMARLQAKLRQADRLADKLESQIAEAEAKTVDLETAAFGAADRPPQKGDKFRILDKETETDSGGKRIRHRVYVREGDAVPEKYQAYTDRGVWEVRGIKNGRPVLWRDFTKAERMKMGQILDARYTITKTFMLLAHDISMGRFFRDIADNPEWSRAPDDEPDAGTWMDPKDYDRIIGGHWGDSKVEWVRVPDTTIPKSTAKTYGKLAGRFVRAEIWRDLTMIEDGTKSSIWTEILKQWKLNMTARNPAVHGHNIASNFVLMEMADIRARDLVSGIRSMVRKDDIYKEAVDAGVLDSGMTAVEMRREVLEPILNEINKQNGNTLIGNFGLLGVIAKAIHKPVKGYDDWMRWAYSMEDDIFRMGAYIRRRGQGMSIEEAAKEAREQFIDYDIRAPWINAARRTVLPFIAYPYRAIPLIARTITLRPWKVAKMAVILYGVNALWYALAPSGDDEDRERRSLPENEQGHIWMGPFPVGPRMLRLGTDGEKNPVFLDLRRWSPGSDFLDFSRPSAIDIPAWAMPSGPLILGLELAFNWSAFSQRQIHNPEIDDAGEKYAKAADYFWKSAMPNTPILPFSRSYERIVNAAYGVREPVTGRPYNLPQAVANSVGIHFKPQDVEAGMERYGRSFGRYMQDQGAELRRLGSDMNRGAVSKETFDRKSADIKSEIEEKRKRVQDIMKK